MKRQIILLICIILIGGMAIILPSLFSSYLNRKEVKNIKVQDRNHEEFLKSIESTLDMIEEPEILEGDKESELYDENQMYFENIEILYDYLKFNQVEYTKEKMQFYIHENVNKDVLDCKLLRDTIRQKDNVISFNLEVESSKLIEVIITKDNEGNIVDFTIVHSIKN